MLVISDKMRFEESLETLLNQLANHEFSTFLKSLQNKKHIYTTTIITSEDSFSRQGAGTTYYNTENGKHYVQKGTIFRTHNTSTETHEIAYAKIFWNSLHFKDGLRNNYHAVNLFLKTIFSLSQPTDANFSDFLETLDFFINDCMPRNWWDKKPAIDFIEIYYAAWKRLTDPALRTKLLEHANLKFATSPDTFALNKLRVQALIAGIPLSDDQKKIASDTQSLMKKQAQKILDLIQWLQKAGYATIDLADGSVTFSAGNHMAINDIGYVLNNNNPLAVVGSSTILEGVNYLQLNSAVTRDDIEPHHLDKMLIDIDMIHNKINNIMNYHANKGFLISLHRRYKAWETKKASPEKGTSVEMLNSWKSNQQQSVQISSKRSWWG